MADVLEQDTHDNTLALAHTGRIKSERSAAHTTSSDDRESHPSTDLPAHYARPQGIRGFHSSTTMQIVFLGFVCFMCPGLFNALNGLGGGGQVDATTSANANSALYATFAVAAFFAGYVVCLRSVCCVPLY